MADAIRIGEPAIEVRVRRSARARRMVLRVAQAGRTPILTLPHSVPIAQARAFLRDHEDWLRHHIDAQPIGTAIGDGSLLPFGDRTLTVRMQPGRVRLSGDLLHVPGPAARIAPRVAAWLREEARLACAAGAARHAAVLGRMPGRITLRDPRSRWGSCTAHGDLMFSWRLAMAPTSVLDYVVAHEVAHLVEMNHSPQFWAIVEQLYPDHAAARDWLRRHGATLHGHDFAAAPT